MTRSLLTLALAATLSTLSAGAGDWPQFRGAARDAKSTDGGLLKRWPEGGPRLLFAKTGLGAGYSQAVVSSGLVYVTGGVEGVGYVSAFDLDGNPVWRESYGPTYPGARGGRYAGARSTPAVREGRLFVAGSGGQLVCFDARTGKRRWALDFFEKYGVPPAKWGFSESVLVDGNRVLLTTGGETLMVALSVEDGSVVWTTPGIEEASSYCSPILLERGGTRLVVTITDTHVVGIDADSGRLLWKQDFAGGKRRNYATTPVYADGLLFCSGGYGKGSEILTLAEDGKSVRVKNKIERPDNHHGNLVLVDGLVYGTGQQNGGQWVCVELATGQVRWEAQGVGKGSVSFADGFLYCYGERGRFALVRPSAEGYEELGSFQVPAGTAEHWAHPTIAGGRLYVRHGDTLMVYDVKGE